MSDTNTPSSSQSQHVRSSLLRRNTFLLPYTRAAVFSKKEDGLQGSILSLFAASEYGFIQQLVRATEDD